MSSSGTWYGGTNGDPKPLVEFRVPPSGLALLFLGPRPSLCVLRADELSSAGDAAWFSAAAIQRGSTSSVRLIGASDLIRKYGPILQEAGLVAGKHVTVDSPNTVLQFVSADGRLRMERNVPTKVRHRVLVVDDSETIRKLLRAVISQDEALECVGTVALPSLVEKAIQELNPDVITLDIHMPEMTGNELLKKILPKYRIPIIMISSLSMEDGNYVLDALEAGAVDYIQKPSMQELKILAPVICEKLKTAANVKIAKVSRPRPSSRAAAIGPGELDFGCLIAIGSSTGGTEALKAIFSSLPAKIPPVVVVQHIPPVFSKAFADRMNQLFPFEVKEAVDGDEVRPDRILIAPGGLQMHLQERGGRLVACVQDAPPVNRHKPSVDVLFDSIAELKRKKVVAGILTGMGADGARGLLKLRQSGAKTLAQDEATSVVFGMPREAIKLGAAEQIVPIQEVGNALMKLCTKRSSSKSVA